MTRALVALGSNLGGRLAMLTAAAAALAKLPGTELLALSAFRETQPVDAPPGSPAFLNAAALLETALSPRELLIQLAQIEAAHGRERSVHNGPRTLDLDLLLHGDAVLDEPGLVLPHPRAHLRAFVLEPAAEVARDMLHPVLGQSLGSLRDRLRQTEASPA